MEVNTPVTRKALSRAPDRMRVTLNFTSTLASPRAWLQRFHFKLFSVGLLALWTASAHAATLHVLVGAAQLLAPTERHLDGVFEGLTRVTSNGKVMPALASRWTSDARGVRWTFRLRANLRDHLSKPLHADNLLPCFEPVLTSLEIEHLVSVSTNEIQFQLRRPQLRFAERVASIKYFRWGAGPDCAASSTRRDFPVGTGPLRIGSTNLAKGWIDLHDPTRLDRVIRVHAFRDETTALASIRAGGWALVHNAFSAGKTHFIEHRLGWHTISRPGVVTTLLLLNGKSPALVSRDAREHLVRAVDWKPWITRKGFGHWAPTPFVESLGVFQERPQGVPPKEIFGLVTPTGIGLENALAFRLALQSAGIQFRLRILDRAAYGRALQDGAFDWAIQRVMDGDFESAARDYLHSKGSKNFSGIRSIEIDQRIERGDFESAWQRAEQDRRVMRLWTWDNVIQIQPEFAKWMGPHINMIERSLSQRGDMRELWISLMNLPRWPL